MAVNPIPLLPCPWCGSGDLEATCDGNGYTAVECQDCNATGPAFGDGSGDLQAVNAWNKGPYADRLEIHAKALATHADALRAQAAEHMAKADELLKKATEATK
jgi:Lar family restriction alleviation protein